MDSSFLFAKNTTSIMKGVNNMKVIKNLLSAIIVGAGVSIGVMLANAGVKLMSAGAKKLVKKN